MNFRDQPLNCTVCGKTFIFTVTEQRRMYEESRDVRETPVARSALDAQPDAVVPPSRCRSCRLRDPETGRWSGRIKWYSDEKGYGFIVKPDEDEIFFHRSQVIDEPMVSLKEGVSVTFQEVATDRGAEAQQVKVESQHTASPTQNPAM